MEILIPREKLDDLIWLKDQLDAIKAEIEKEKNAIEPNEEKLKQLKEMEKMIGFRYEWLIKPI